MASKLLRDCDAASTENRNHSEPAFKVTELPFGEEPRETYEVMPGPRLALGLRVKSRCEDAPTFRAPVRLRQSAGRGQDDPGPPGWTALDGQIDTSHPHTSHTLPETELGSKTVKRWSTDMLERGQAGG